MTPREPLPWALRAARASSRRGPWAAVTVGVRDGERNAVAAARRWKASLDDPRIVDASRLKGGDRAAAQQQKCERGR